MMTDTEQPKGLRKNLDRMSRRVQRQNKQIDRLTRMLLMSRIADGDIDFSESLDLLDHYRPEWTDVATFDEQFSPEAVTLWLAGRQR